MSVYNIGLDTNLEDNFNQYLDYNVELKELYGEVNTPFNFINKMLSIIPENKFLNKSLKWLDAGAGHGNYSICLFFILFKSLKEIIPDANERKEHIIKEMIYMVEINKENICFLREKFGVNGNIFEGDYLEWDSSIKFDCIIGNPPYNFNGVKKVPTKNDVNKKEDGRTIWCEFIKKNLSMLKENGIMNVLIPAIWMKPDKAGMYKLLLKYEISKLHTLNANETNKTFRFNVQTPICYFLLTKLEGDRKIELYDTLKQKYETIILQENMPIPLDFVSIVKKCLIMCETYGKLNVIKTNLPKKNSKVVDTYSSLFSYANIKTTKLNKKKSPYLEVNYSNEPLMFYGDPKIIMAHKMYGFPYIDREGKYGICSRDNYVIKDKSINELELIKYYLSTELILFLYETTRYRMRYLEKYAFEFIPDFSNIPKELLKTKESIYDLIGINSTEKKYIEGYYKIKYSHFE
jgi:hypothetical protein